ncbi:MAG: HAD-IA family hydrolase [Arenimonas sp.]|nr:HAD-IA family hydrolase [Arenimonas sp.]
MAPKLLLLDLDDVLVDYNQEQRCRALAETAGVDPAFIHRAVFSSGLEKRCDRGEFEIDEYMNRLRIEWGLDIPVNDFIVARRASTRVRPAMIDLCTELAPEIRLGIFTNNGYWLQLYAERIVPELMPLFGTRFISSGSLGLTKPDPVAFACCVERLGFSASSTLFVDDKVENVEGARLAGLDAFVFENESQFVNELRIRGLTTGENYAF